MGKNVVNRHNQGHKKITHSTQLKNTIIMTVEKLKENQYNVLTPERELELLKKYKLDHDQDAYAEILYSNFSWICTCALDYRDNIFDMEDLIQEGYFGFMKAIEKFDYTSGNRLNTYATIWIHRYMKAFINNNEFLIRIPEMKRINMRAIIQKSRELEQKLFRKPTIEEVAKEVNFPVEKVKSLLDLIYWSKTISLDDDKINTSNELETLYIDNSSEEILEMAQKKAVQKCLNCLTLKEQEIICLHFGLIDGKEYSYEEIGRKFNVTRACIYQIVKKSLEEIRKKVNQLKYDEETLSEIDTEDFRYQTLCQIKPTKKEKKKQKKLNNKKS